MTSVILVSNSRTLDLKVMTSVLLCRFLYFQDKVKSFLLWYPLHSLLIALAPSVETITNWEAGQLFSKRSYVLPAHSHLSLWWETGWASFWVVTVYGRTGVAPKWTLQTLLTDSRWCDGVTQARRSKLLCVITQDLCTDENHSEWRHPDEYYLSKCFQEALTSQQHSIVRAQSMNVLAPE